MIIAIKGFIGSGKTTVTKMWKQEDSSFESINGDEEVKKLYDTNDALIQKIADKFDLDIKDGKLDRKKIGEIVFSNIEKLNELENIVQPYIQKILEKKIEEVKKKGKNLLLDCPTIDKYAINYDYEVLCFATKETLIKRIKSRDKRSLEEIKKILKIQEGYNIQKVISYTINTEQKEDKQREDIRKIKEILSVKDSWKNS